MELENSAFASETGFAPYLCLPSPGPLPEPRTRGHLAASFTFIATVKPTNTGVLFICRKAIKGKGKELVERIPLLFFYKFSEVVFRR
jgi:hypothetical protein